MEESVVFIYKEFSSTLIKEKVGRNEEWEKERNDLHYNRIIFQR